MKPKKETTLLRGADPPVISVVVVGGPEAFGRLPTLISSVKRSVFKDYELIVVDNSGDKKVGQLFRMADNKVRYIKMPANTGVLGFNVGFANTRGRYVLALDDDCMIRRDTLGNAVTSFSKKSEAVGVLSANICEGKDISIFQSRLDGGTKNLVVAANMAVFRKQIFEKVGYYDEDFFLWVHEDDLSIRILDKGFQIEFDPAIVVDHRLRYRYGVDENFLFHWSRNLAWFNLKHFPFYLLPLLVSRNIASFLMAPVKRRTLRVLPYLFVGYVLGYLTAVIPLRKRKVVSPGVQAKFIRYLFTS